MNSKIDFGEVSDDQNATVEQSHVDDGLSEADESHANDESAEVAESGAVDQARVVDKSHATELPVVDESSEIDDLPIFSPLNKRGKNGPIPDFLRKLEPKMFAEIRKKTTGEQDQMQSQPSKTSSQEEKLIAGTSQQKQVNESATDSIVKHTLNTNHLHFPGKCTFVSLTK